MLYRATKKNVAFRNMCALIQIRNDDEFDIEYQEVQYWVMLSKYRYNVQLGLMDYNAGEVSLRQPVVVRGAVDVFTKLFPACTGVGAREFAVTFDAIGYRFGMTGNVTDDVVDGSNVPLKDLEFIVKKKLPEVAKLKDAVGEELHPVAAIAGAAAADGDDAAIVLLGAVVDDAAAHADDGDGIDAPNDDDPAHVVAIAELHKSIKAIEQAGDELVVADAVAAHEGDPTDAALDAGIAAGLAAVAGGAAPAVLCVPPSWEDVARNNVAIATVAAMKAHPLGGPLGANVSLVMMLGGSASAHVTHANFVMDVCFVAWNDADAKVGQPLFTDDQGRLKMSVHADFPFRSYAGCVVIDPDIGVEPPRRSSAKQPIIARPFVPPNVLTLRQMWTTSVGNSTPGRCSMCLLHSSSADNALRRCCICLMVFHDKCAEEVSTLVDIGVSGVPVGLRAASVCKLCGAFK
jgi:hypothetical protein